MPTAGPIEELEGEVGSTGRFICVLVEVEALAVVVQVSEQVISSPES